MHWGINALNTKLRMHRLAASLNWPLETLMSWLIESESLVQCFIVSGSLTHCSIDSLIQAIQVFVEPCFIGWLWHHVTHWAKLIESVVRLVDLTHWYLGPLIWIQCIFASQIHRIFVTLTLIILFCWLVNSAPWSHCFMVYGYIKSLALFHRRIDPESLVACCKFTGSLIQRFM